MGSIAMSYSEKHDRGSFIAMSVNLQAVGAAIGSIIPLIINRDRTDVAGVPTAVYIIFIALMGLACLLSFLLKPPSKIVRDDGTRLFTVKSRGWLEELKANLEIFKDWRLAIMIPAFLPSECFLIYSGSVNAYHNDLRTRSLLSFLAVVIQVPCGFGLKYILDHKTRGRQKRALIGLAVVSIPLTAAWIWEIVRVRDYNRRDPPKHPLDWTEPRLAPTLILFAMTWVSSVLFQYITLYFLSALTNSPRKAAVYAVSHFPVPLHFPQPSRADNSLQGVYRSFLAAEEAICFGVDSLGMPYIKEAGTIFAFYAAGVLGFLYLAVFEVTETEYFTGEEGVVVPTKVVKEHPEMASKVEVELNADIRQVIVSAKTAQTKDAA